MRKPHYFKLEGKWHKFDPTYHSIYGVLLFVREDGDDPFAPFGEWHAIMSQPATAVIRDRIFDTERPRFGADSDVMGLVRGGWGEGR